MKKSTIAKIAAFATAMLWGSTFAIGKLAAEVFSASFTQWKSPMKQSSAYVKTLSQSRFL